MKEAYKFRIYPTRAQAAQIGRTIGCCRHVWNFLLALKRANLEEVRQRRYELLSGGLPEAEVHEQVSGLYLTDAVLSKLLTAHKQDPEFAWLNEVSAQALKQELQHLRTAFTRWRKGLAEQPRFKKRDHGGSFEQQQNTAHTQNRLVPHASKSGFSWLSFCLFQPLRSGSGANFGPILLQRHRDLPDGAILETVTISRTASGEHHAALVVTPPTEEPALLPVRPETTLGLLRGELALEASDGRSWPHLLPLQRDLERLRVLDRRLVKKRRRNPDFETSNRYHELRRQRARLHERIARQRLDCQHKTTAALIAGAESLGVDDRTVQARMASPRGLPFADAALYELKRQLEYKARRSGRNFAAVPGATADEVRDNALRVFLAGETPLE